MIMKILYIRICHNFDLQLTTAQTQNYARTLILIHQRVSKSKAMMMKCHNVTNFQSCASFVGRQSNYRRVYT